MFGIKKWEKNNFNIVCERMGMDSNEVIHRFMKKAVESMTYKEGHLYYWFAEEFKVGNDVNVDSEKMELKKIVKSLNPDLLSLLEDACEEARKGSYNVVSLNRFVLEIVSKYPRCHQSLINGESDLEHFKEVLLFLINKELKGANIPAFSEDIVSFMQDLYASCIVKGTEKAIELEHISNSLININYFDYILDKIAEEGNLTVDQKKYAEAIDIFHSAIDAMPRPVEKYHSYVWFSVALGDAYILSNKYDMSMEWWNRAIYFGGIGNPFIHFKRGQALYELGAFEEASNEFLKVLIIDGIETFISEDEKYINYILSQAEPPEGVECWDDWCGADQDSDMYRWVVDINAYEILVKKRH